ncbi:MAG: Nif3-like dinuclear metal center hexameric protein [Verrucomicrobiota bacterium]
MAKTLLQDLVSHCDRLLRTREIPDYDKAANGLQAANDGTVTRIAAAVDASLATVRLAVEAGADLLIVHHGLFWGQTQPWTGPRLELIRLLVQNNLAVYSSHLPLDAHPKLGNNSLLCAALGFKSPKPYHTYKGFPIGLRVARSMERDELVRRLDLALEAPEGRSVVRLIPGGPGRCKKIGIVTGGAGSELHQAADAGLDTLITGEGPHWTYSMAEELGLNVLYGGHYATETFGVKALAGHLSKKYHVPWTFLDHPTGL